MYKSEFIEVNYNEADNAIIIGMKKFCSGEDYRKPLRYSLTQLKNNQNTNLIIDARNGFEDEQEDVVWVFNEFIPQLAKTNCKMIVFITNQVNDIKAEIDMFTLEFMKYFEVIKVLSMEEALDKLSK